MHELVELGTQVAREAGRLALKMRTEAVQSPNQKTSVTDLVTTADLAAQELINTALLSARPDDAIIGEEGSGGTGASGVQWIVDPIDGTHNYVRGSGPFGVAIGIEVDGELQGGVVYAPLADELFAAWHGKGATCNDIPIHVSALQDPTAAMIAYDSPTYQDSNPAQQRVVNVLLANNGLFRRIGSAVVAFSWVACGRFDAFIQMGGGYWDMAAGSVIAAEAGGQVEKFELDGLETTLAANSAVFDFLVPQLKKSS